MALEKAAPGPVARVCGKNAAIVYSLRQYLSLVLFTKIIANEWSEKWQKNGKVFWLVSLD